MKAGSSFRSLTFPRCHVRGLVCRCIFGVQLGSGCVLRVDTGSLLRETVQRMLDQPAVEIRNACSTNPNRPAPRPATASRRSRSGGPARPHRPADQQGHRAHPAGALAVHRRHAGGPAPRVPVHQRHRLQGPQIRHAGGGRRAGRRRRRSTRSAWAGRSRRSARPGWRRSPIRSRRSPTNDAPCQEVVITGDALKTRRAEGAAGAGLDAGLRRRALSHRDALRHHGPRERRAQHGHLSRGAESRRTAPWCAWWRARRPARAAICIG